MPYLKKKDTGAVTDYIEFDSVEYQTLVKMKFQVATTIPGTGGFGAGSGGSYSAGAGTPVWETVAEEDTGLPGSTTNRALVIYMPPVAAGADETIEVQVPEQVKGEVTGAFYVPLAAINGVATNNRIHEFQQVQLTATPARVVKKLAKLEWKNGVNNSGLLVPTELPLEATPEFNPGEDLQLVSKKNGTGIADPGGVFYAIYTRL